MSVLLCNPRDFSKWPVPSLFSQTENFIIIDGHVETIITALINAKKTPRKPEIRPEFVLARSIRADSTDKTVEGV